MFAGQRLSSPVVINVIIANVMVWLAMTLLPIRYEMLEYGALFNLESPLFKPFQVFTYMFMHADVWHLLFNMYALWMFGRVLEYEIGSRRFFIYYMVCGIGAALVQMGVGYLEYSSMAAEATSVPQLIELAKFANIPTIGASGAVFGLLLAFGLMHPNNVIMLLIPPMPIKAKWFVIVYGLLEFFFGVSGVASGVAHFAHLGGMLWGLALLLWWKKQRKIYF
ncbi:MAG: rhomboid family intramembrane serine protease [Alistipes sp.]|nr:rhomboid family intramembrane serine protease [Alistipes sp.]